MNLFKIIPNEIIEKILFQYLNDIELKIYFNRIGKIDISKFKFLNKIISNDIKSFSLFYRRDSTSYVYRYIHISDNKFYRLTFEFDDGDIYGIIKTEICNHLIPMYSSFISENIY